MLLDAEASSARRRSLTTLAGLVVTVTLATLTALWGATGVAAGAAALALVGAGAWLACRSAQAAAERAAARARRELVAGISHELRTPLNGVIGFSNVLLRVEGGKLTPSERQYLERVQANGVQMLGVVEELFARAEGATARPVQRSDAR